MLKKDKRKNGERKRVIKMGEGKAGIFQRKGERYKGNEEIGVKKRGIY